VATEAARAALEFGWALGLREVLAVVAPGNVRSLRVVGKLGMTPRADRWHPPSGGRVHVFGVRPDR
jgi:RimJ/RimL family protein N-acetyltransferase